MAEEELSTKKVKDGISVLMSIYKNETVPYFKEAMESILNQTRMPDEIILIEDGELYEELEHCIREYEKSCDILRVCRLKQNVGLGRALAKGAVLCGYEFIARMDTDDIAVSDRLLRQSEFLLKNPGISAVGGWIEEFNDEGTLNRIKKMPETNEEILAYGRYRNPMNHGTVMIRRRDLMECGNYRHFLYLEDYYLWSRMMAFGKQLYNIPDVLVRLRTNEAIYGRRGGISYMLRYLELRRIQKNIGLTHGAEYLKAVFLTIGITIIPPKARKLVYQKILRRMR